MCLRRTIAGKAGAGLPTYCAIVCNCPVCVERMDEHTLVHDILHPTTSNGREEWEEMDRGTLNVGILFPSLLEGLS